MSTRDILIDAAHAVAMGVHPGLFLRLAMRRPGIWWMPRRPK